MQFVCVWVTQAVIILFTWCVHSAVNGDALIAPAFLLIRA